MNEKSKSDQEILKRMPEWFLILKQAYKEYKDKYTRREANANEGICQQ